MKDRNRAKVRYAVVGLGWISQDAMLPGFANAKANSELVALVSGDAEKLRKVGKHYGITHLYRYEDYDKLLHSGEIDAVYIALPNSMHCDYTVRAARAGVHVLCEKPMALNEMECGEMLRAAREGQVRLMIAYRLHFEACHLHAIELARAGTLGDLRLFDSVFTMDVKAGDIRLQAALGGGTLYDIGVYCINAARYLFHDEPTSVSAHTTTRNDGRFDEVDEMVAAVLRFPGQRVATFQVSFGAAPVSSLRLVGTKGDLRIEPAYQHEGDLVQHLTVAGKTKERTFKARDQFGPQLVYFSQCLLDGRDPEPNGVEGMADVRIVRALLASAAQGGQVLDIAPTATGHVDGGAAEPGLHQEIRRPEASKPALVKAETPHK